MPWELLRTARDRAAAIAIVLDRVPNGEEANLARNLTGMLLDNDLIDIPLFVLGESQLGGAGLLAETLIEPLQTWIATVARSATTRVAVVRQTVGGAIDALEPTTTKLAAAAADQVDALETLVAQVQAAYETAGATVEWGIRDGALLRGEVLARWHGLVATGEVTRLLPSRIRWLHEQVGWTSEALTTRLGRVHPRHHFRELLLAGITALLRDAVANGAERATSALRAHPAGAALLAAAPGTATGTQTPGTATGTQTPGTATGTKPPGTQTAGTATGSPGAPSNQPGPARAQDAQVRSLVAQWQQEVLAAVRAEASAKLSAEPTGKRAGRAGRRAERRRSAYAIDASALLVMVRALSAPAVDPDLADTVPPKSTSSAAAPGTPSPAAAPGTPSPAPDPGTPSPAADPGITDSDAATLPAQRVLDRLFDRASARNLIIHARDDLLAMAQAMLDGQSARYTQLITAAGVDRTTGDRLRQQARAVTIARLCAGLPAARTAPACLPATPPDPGKERTP